MYTSKFTHRFLIVCLKKMDDLKNKSYDDENVQVCIKYYAIQNLFS